VNFKISLNWKDSNEEIEKANVTELLEGDWS